MLLQFIYAPFHDQISVLRVLQAVTFRTAGASLTALALSLLQQLMGLNAISYYGPQILERMGFHMDAAFLGVLIARSLNLLATMIIVLIVDRVGRKPLLIVGALTMGVSMLAMGALFENDNTGTYGLIAMCCYMVGLGMSFGPIVWILMSEIFPTPIRGQAMSVAISAQWSANFLVSFTFPVMFGDAWLNGARPRCFPTSSDT